MLPVTQHLCVKDTCSSSCIPPAPTCATDVIYENLIIPTVSYCAGLHLTILSLPIRLERVCHLALHLLIPLYTILKDNPGQQDTYYHCPHLAVKKLRNIRFKYLAPNLSKPREEAGFSSKLLNAVSWGLICGLGKRTLGPGSQITRVNTKRSSTSLRRASWVLCWNGISLYRATYHLSCCRALGKLVTYPTLGFPHL